MLKTKPTFIIFDFYILNFNFFELFHHILQLKTSLLSRSKIQHKSSKYMNIFRRASAHLDGAVLPTPGSTNQIPGNIPVTETSFPIGQRSDTCPLPVQSRYTDTYLAILHRIKGSFQLKTNKSILFTKDRCLSC